MRGQIHVAPSGDGAGVDEMSGVQEAGEEAFEPVQLAAFLEAAVDHGRKEGWFSGV